MSNESDPLTEDEVRAIIDKMSRGYSSDPEICARARARYGHLTAKPLVDVGETQVSLPGFAAEKDPT
jgi:hypothetical protein